MLSITKGGSERRRREKQRREQPGRAQEERTLRISAWQLQQRVYRREQQRMELAATTPPLSSVRRPVVVVLAKAGRMTLPLRLRHDGSCRPENVLSSVVLVGPWPGWILGGFLGGRCQLRSWERRTRVDQYRWQMEARVVGLAVCHSEDARER